MSDTIREFLVSLGFEVREDTLNRFERAIEGATLRAKLLGDAIEGMASSAAESRRQDRRQFRAPLLAGEAAQYIRCRHQRIRLRRRTDGR